MSAPGRFAQDKASQAEREALAEPIATVAGSGTELHAWRRGVDTILLGSSVTGPIMRANGHELLALLDEACQATLADVRTTTVIGKLGKVHVSALPGRFVRISDHPEPERHSPTQLRLDAAESLADAIRDALPARRAEAKPRKAATAA
jgi:hypothetical protein